MRKRLLFCASSTNFGRSARSVRDSNTAKLDARRQAVTFRRSRRKVRQALACHSDRKKQDERGCVRPAFGRSDRTRTCSILLPKQARYQLRHTSEMTYRYYSNDRTLCQAGMQKSLPSRLLFSCDGHLGICSADRSLLL